MWINPDYEKVFSKTGELDESLHISRAWIGALLVQHLHHSRGHMLWNFGLAKLCREFLTAAQALCLMHIKLVLYMARHSGSSLDMLEGRLSLQEVQRRGRWRSEASVRRYEKRAMLQQVSSTMSVAQKQRFLTTEQELPTALAHELTSRVSQAR